MAFGCLRSALVLLSVLMCAAAHAADWPQFQYGPNRASSSDEKSLPNISDIRTLKRHWIKRRSANNLVAGYFHGPIVSNGLVISCMRKNVFAHSAKTGELVWTRLLSEICAGSAAATSKTVYLASGFSVFALDIETGALRWRYNTRNTNIYRAPILAEGKIFISSDDRSEAIDANTGKFIWSSSHVLVAYSEGRLYGSDAGYEKIVSVSAKTGDTLNILAKNLLYVGSVQLYENTIYVTTQNKMTAINKFSGDVQWEAETEFFYSPGVAISEGHVILFDGVVSALDAKNGKQVWKTKTKGSNFGLTTLPAIANSIVYVGSYSGLIVALSLKDGSELWSDKVGANSIPVGSVAVADSAIYFVGRNSGNIYAYSTK